MNAIIYLYVIWAGYGHAPKISQFAMPDIKTCQESVQNSKFKVSDGAESENGFISFCAGKMEKLNWVRKEID